LANLLVLRSEFSTSEGTMLTSWAGARTLWSNLLTVVAGATAPFGRWNTMEDRHLIFENVRGHEFQDITDDILDSN
jgi:hypothetical protein